VALISYTLPDTGEVVPLLQVVPSKNDQEWLLLVTPELASVLASIITRVRGADGRVPLVARWDEHERVLGPTLPHLLQRKYAWRDVVISTTTVQNLISATIARAGLVDRTGKPLRYTPHDFRWMFATEAVTGGLPVHIARASRHGTQTASPRPDHPDRNPTRPLPTCRPTARLPRNPVIMPIPHPRPPPLTSAGTSGIGTTMTSE